MTDIKILWRHHGQCYVACSIIKHDRFGGGSLMVWGIISLEAHTDLYVIGNDTLTAVRSRDEILRAVVRPYTDAVDSGFLMVQISVQSH